MPASSDRLFFNKLLRFLVILVILVDVGALRLVFVLFCFDVLCLYRLPMPCLLVFCSDRNREESASSPAQTAPSLTAWKFRCLTCFLPMTSAGGERLRPLPPRQAPVLVVLVVVVMMQEHGS